VGENAIYEDIEFDFVMTDDRTSEEEVRTVVAHYPGEAALMILFATIGAGGITDGRMVFDFLSQTFSPQDFEFIKKMLSRNLMSLDMLQEMIEELFDEEVGWLGGFPTQQQSDSPPTRGRTGTRSTGRVPGKGSTQPASPPDAS
jgi:hypothetical protein